MSFLQPYTRELTLFSFIRIYICAPTYEEEDVGRDRNAT